MNEFPLPIIGFCGYSGVGKTTLLTQLISLLTTEGIRVAVVKHAHHDFDTDHPGKDSYELRHAGASQMLVASRRRTALIMENKNSLREPRLADVLTNLRREDIDLVLVEGYKQEAIPKIELHRSGRNRPLLFPSDPNIVAIACDYEIDPGDHPVTTLDINNIQQISLFIRHYMPNKRVAAIR